MKRVVLSMMAVFFVQAAFIAYTAIERESDEIVAENGVPAIWGPAKNDTVMVADAEPPVTDSEPLAGESIKANVVVYVRRRSVAPQILADRRIRPVTRTTNAIFEPQIIKVPIAKARPMTELALTTSNRPDTKGTLAVSRTVPRPEKRSFAAKSVSVLKKPYDWLKAVASRMR